MARQLRDRFILQYADDLQLDDCGRVSDANGNWYTTFGTKIHLCCWFTNNTQLNNNYTAKARRCVMDAPPCRAWRPAVRLAGRSNCGLGHGADRIPQAEQLPAQHLPEPAGALDPSALDRRALPLVGTRPSPGTRRGLPGKRSNNGCSNIAQRLNSAG